MNVKEFYNEFYERAEKSTAHARFCELVYGKNLCQHGMADMVQIEEIIKLLGLNKNDRILDLGCGIGHITEYLYDRTNGFVTGVDISEIAIEKAKERTKGKNNLKFEIADIEELGYPSNSFNKIISIDTHYFVDDFEKFILYLIKILSPGGKIGVFSDEGLATPGHDDSELEACESLIGKTLQKHKFKYKAINFTERNHLHWKLKEKVLIELKEEFIKEDNSFLFKQRIEECTRSNRDFDCRFLFVIEKSE